MLLVTIAFFLLLIIGMPVAFAIGISGSLFFLQHPELPFTIPVQRTVSQTQNFALLAIPLFIMAGSLANHSGITERLLTLASVVSGRLRGGLAQVTIALSAMMGGVSGSAIADAAMQSRMLGPEMLRRNLARGFATGILGFSALITPIVPPGIGMVLFGTIGQVSVGRLFAAGIVPALILWLALAVTVSVVSRKRGYPPERTSRLPPGETGRALRGGVWALLFPVLLLAGLRMGVFTPSEIGAFAVVYVVAIGYLVHRKLTTTNASEAIEASLVDVGAVMFLIALSAIFSYGIVMERVPETISNVIVGQTQNLIAVELMILVFVLAIGFFVDATVLIIMLTPLFLPVIESLEGDPVHFGIVFIITAAIGNFTPPVGAAMYAVCTIMKCSVEEYTRGALPFFFASMAVILLLVLVPQLVLFLPNLIFG
ncbi:TRAP transporter large permease [Litchfieldella rifensis]|uniref:TRAP transporter large permease protein n=1 Tax=Litchfieldella rifensis TaxID=762643 RepID=A0ABV7LKB8_9GAMM